MKENSNKRYEKNIDTKEITIVIADDEIKNCKEIENALKKNEQIKILGIANTDEEEIRMIEELDPEIVITDLKRGDSLSGLDIIKDYAEKEKSPKFIIVSFSPDYRIV